MAAGGYDIETQKASRNHGKLATTSIDIKCINYDTDVLIDAKSMRKWCYVSCLQVTATSQMATSA